MADYQFNTNLGPAAQQGTSLGDMINTARGIQAYQQQNQLNPLQLQKAQMEIEQAQKINPLAVRQQTAQTGKSEFDLEKSYAEKERSVLGGFANDPDFINGNQAGMIQKLKTAKGFLKAIGVPEHPEDTSDQIMQIASKDAKSVLPYLKNMIQGEIGATGQQALQTPQLATVAGAPATFQSGTGTAKELNIGGQGNTGLAQPPAVGAPNVGTAPTGVTPTQMGLQYPVRRAGDIRPIAPNETQDAERGAKYRNDLTTRQTDLSKSRRNLDEVIEAAGKISKEDLFSTGVLGAATRSIKGALGDEKYKQLSKDLANVQISNMAAMGGSMETDAGKQLIRMANGDETYPPEVLKNIARRTYADLTNLDMQATAASKFAKKYGDSNLNTFKQQWSQNADSKVFEAMSLFENIKDSAKRKDEIDRLLGNNPEQRQQFFQKYNNIKKLTATGEL
ncbi:MAG: hypothetical protein RL018_1294 [Pseudomonadota bacterium]|jgi:hypothetical protein